MRPPIDVQAMATQLLPLLGDDSDVEAFLQNHVEDARGSREHRLAEWFVKSGYSHVIEAGLAEPLGNWETRQLLTVSGITDIPAGVPGRIRKWLESHNVPSIAPAPGTHTYRPDLDALRTQIADRWDDIAAAGDVCVKARRKLEMILKEVVAYQWGLILTADPDCMPQLCEHVEKHRKQFYGNDVAIDSPNAFMASIANSTLTARPLIALLRKCVALAKDQPMLHRELVRLTGDTWRLGNDDLQACEKFFGVLHPDTHDTPSARRPSIDDVQACWDRFDTVFDAWRAGGIFPRIIQRKELAETEWGCVVRVFDLTEWRGPQFNQDLPVLELYCGDSEPPTELLENPPKPMFAYLANNPISIRFHVRPRPDRLSAEMGNR